MPVKAFFAFSKAPRLIYIPLVLQYKDDDAGHSGSLNYFEQPRLIDFSWFDYSTVIALYLEASCHIDTYKAGAYVFLMDYTNSKSYLTSKIDITETTSVLKRSSNFLTDELWKAGECIYTLVTHAPDEWFLGNKIQIECARLVLEVIA